MRTRCDGVRKSLGRSHSETLFYDITGLLSCALSMASDTENEEPKRSRRVPTNEDDLSGSEDLDYDLERQICPSPRWFSPMVFSNKLAMLDGTRSRKVYRKSGGETMFSVGPGEADLLGYTVEDIDQCGKAWDDIAWMLVERFFRGKTMVQQQLDSFNHFLTTGLAEIIVDSPPVIVTKDPMHFKNRPGEPVKCELQFTRILVEKAKIYEDTGARKDITPNECRLRNLTYESSIFADIEERIYGEPDPERIARKRRERPMEVKRHLKVHLGNLPMMVRSNFCILHGVKTDEELASLLECPMDPGGYFIISGSEKAVVTQERLALNQVMVVAVEDKKYAYKAEIYSSPESSYSVHTRYFCVNLMAKNRKERFEKGQVGRPITVTLPYVKQEIPLVVLFRALGCDVARQIISLIILDENPDDEMASNLLPSFDQAFPIQTQDVALNFIGTRALKPGVVRKERIENARNLLDRHFLPAVGVTSESYQAKAFFLGYMVHRLLSTALGRRDVDDRDHYGNKRLDMVGTLFSSLFRALFSKMKRETALYIQKKMEKDHAWNIELAIRVKTVSDGLRYSLATGNWGDVKSCGKRTGITQVVNRMTYLATISQLRRFVTPINKESRAARPRQLHNTQWGVVCPCETPEGMSVGLVKNLALMACVSVERDKNKVLDALGENQLVAFSELTPTDAGKCTKVFVNGNWLGIHRDPDALVTTLRALRRAETLGPDVSITRSHQQQEIRISTDAGRVCRPLLVVERRGRTCTLALKKGHILALVDKFSRVTWQDLMNSGIVEYVDVNEEENILCAFYPDDLGAYAGFSASADHLPPVYTHCEIHPSMILGVCASNIPFPDHNQSPRNTYQAAMAKQAIGVYASNFHYRHDISAHVLYYPQTPLVPTRAMALYRHDELPSGINCIVAVASYTGYNQEDSIIMNTAAIQRGLFRHTFYRSYTAEESKPGRRQFERIEFPDPEECDGIRPVMYSKLDHQGIVDVDERLSGGDAIIGKTVEFRNPHYVNAENYDHPATLKRDASVFMRTAETGVVDEVMLSQSATGYRFCKVRVRSIRYPVMGDKFASRHGQKGTVGICYHAEDMPFTKAGLVPDIIINPHAIPSRMTVGHLVECLIGKAGITSQKPGDPGHLLEHLLDGTPFSKNHSSKMHEVNALLKRNGYQVAGNEVMYNGFTGCKLNSQIFIGPTYYQRLKHMVDDKVYSRSRGQVTLLTRQPPEGRLQGGGLRVGEMERDCLISHGVALNLRERLFDVSDAYRIHLCNRCGFMAVVNLQRQSFVCRRCRDKHSSISQVMIPYACKLLFQEMMSMGIAPRLLTS
ncbi:DNA-directed RNA polymerase II subunit RPB2 [Hypsibius exemplaris]|uniref:DNA-directed RNA polymerase subunit beta n=1 Tax=Hypsibius exemplaris TaxID=2072580 RepID=A0A1W0WJG1_HYPEX|nr:DNA-directed RNA polymerase II subunit RPB2 [Hypsibius exemplaris]